MGNEEEQAYERKRLRGSIGSSFGASASSVNVTNPTRQVSAGGTGGDISVRLPKAKLNLEVDLGSVDVSADYQSRLADWAIVPVISIPAQPPIPYVGFPQVMERAHHILHEQPRCPSGSSFDIDKAFAIVLQTAAMRLAEMLSAQKLTPVPQINKVDSDPCSKETDTLTELKKQIENLKVDFDQKFQDLKTSYDDQVVVLKADFDNQLKAKQDLITLVANDLQNAYCVSDKITKQDMVQRLQWAYNILCGKDAKADVPCDPGNP